jgi:hypothetical protein
MGCSPYSAITGAHPILPFDIAEATYLQPQCGSLVLMRNTQIEKSLNKKMRARYIGPLIVVSCNYGSAYILAELDGTVLHRPVAAFCLLPYFAHKSIPLPPDFIDIDDTRLREMEHSLTADGDEEDKYQNPTDTLVE